MQPLSHEAEGVKRGVYEHFRGNRYRVLGVGRHSETLEEVVFYEALCGEKSLWARPVSSFVDEVTHNELRVPRFRYVEE
ncbi:MAG: DUF1653 domain-containing protein [Patescibacteria group bacterium]|nr:DUF1653 domain-containing protein [Patescibacteria group bacterium]MDE2439251.1 DUF1653 domain-containing protein [Patescibacteria group bacterium]